jgi:hypothetical protein
MRKHSEWCGRGVCWCDDFYYRIFVGVICFAVLFDLSVIAALFLLLKEGR